MKNTIAVFAFSVVLLSCASTNQKEAAVTEYRPVTLDHSSRSVLNWGGLYKGVIPAADAPGIDVRLTLNGDETYRVTYQYLGKDGVFVHTGYFVWDDTEETITLDNDTLPRYYKVGENRLFQLDMQGNMITGAFASNYILEKVMD